MRRSLCSFGLWRDTTLPFDTYPTESGTARVPQMGEGADKLYAWPPSVRNKNRMR
jgi:hypothetical protein